MTMLPDLIPYSPDDPMPGLRNRVARGAAFFDEHLPDWRSHVDPEVLALESCHRCIRGQLVGGIRGGHLADAIRNYTAYRPEECAIDFPPSLGLDSPAAYHLNLDGAAHDDYTILTRLWREAIIGSEDS